MLRQNPTILCVDENPSMLVDLKRCLELNGSSVLIAADPRRALEVLASQRVDGVILDCYMLQVCHVWMAERAFWPFRMPPTSGGEA